MKKYRYIGHYGKRSRGGFVPHIAVLFFGDEVFHDEEEGKIKFSRPTLDPVDATPEALSVLHGGDFSEDATCEYRFLSGESCTSKPVPGEKLCKFHMRRAASIPDTDKPMSAPDLAKMLDSVSRPTEQVEIPLSDVLAVVGEHSL